MRGIGSEDSSFLLAQFSNEDINRYLFDAEPLSNLQEAEEIITFYTQPEPRNQQRWVLERKSDGASLGTCGFHCWDPNHGTVEMGYDLAKEYWGQGYMYEALRAILEFAHREMNVNQVDAHIYTENRRSIALVEKLGFVITGEKTEHFRNEEYLHHVYSLFRR